MSRWRCWLKLAWYTDLAVLVHLLPKPWTEPVEAFYDGLCFRIETQLLTMAELDRERQRRA